MRAKRREHGPGHFWRAVGIFMGVLALLLVLAVPTAQAETDAVIPPAAGVTPLNPNWKTDQMVVQVWPEYDERAVLVFAYFSLPAEVQLPATLKFAVPHGAVISGIGEIDQDGNFTFPYRDSYPSVESGTEWDIATIQVQRQRALQIDYYYDPGLPTGAGARSFPVLMQLPMDVGSLNLHLQQPARATDFEVQPAMQGSGQASDGFTYTAASFSDAKAGSTLGYVVSYNKPDGNPSIMPGDPASPVPGEPASSQLSTNTVLLAAILVVVVLIGAFVLYRVYRNTGRTAQTEKRERPSKRPGPKASPAATKKKRPAATDESDSADQGKPAARFCFACGEELAKKARFCPSCGESQDD